MTSDARLAARPSPALHANDYPGEIRRGNDGNMWESVPNIKGVHRWVKLAGEGKVSEEKVVAKPKPAAKKKVSSVEPALGKAKKVSTVAKKSKTTATTEKKKKATATKKAAPKKAAAPKRAGSVGSRTRSKSKL
jgi:hypothetical protein